MNTLNTRLAAKQAAPKDDAETTEKAVEAKAAHIEALAQGIKCYQNLRLPMVVLHNGTPVRPTAENVYIAFSPEMEKQLEFFATQRHGLIEEITK